MSKIRFLELYKWTSGKEILYAKIRRTEGEAMVYDFMKYRNSLSENTRWVRHFEWWNGMRARARAQRLAAERANKNSRITRNLRR